MQPSARRSCVVARGRLKRFRLVRERQEGPPSAQRRALRAQQRDCQSLAAKLPLVGWAAIPSGIE